jgi:hypothetical protein
MIRFVVGLLICFFLELAVGCRVERVTSDVDGVSHVGKCHMLFRICLSPCLYLCRCLSLKFALRLLLGSRSSFARPVLNRNRLEIPCPATLWGQKKWSLI